MSHLFRAGPLRYMATLSPVKPSRTQEEKQKIRINNLYWKLDLHGPTIFLVSETLYIFKGNASEDGFT